MVAPPRKRGVFAYIIDGTPEELQSAIDSTGGELCEQRTILRRTGLRGPPRYALRMKRLRAFLERLPGGHRPPTGPLTTSEATEAEELAQETHAKEDDRIEREQEDAREGSNS